MIKAKPKNAQVINLAREVSREAHRKIMVPYRNKMKGIKDAYGNIITEADYKIQDLIVRRIFSEYPTHRIIAEEKFLDSVLRKQNQENNNSEYIWIIDPIDGTSGFVDKDSGYFGTSIGLFRSNGKPLVTTFNAPEYQLGKEKELFFEASSDREGAFLNGKRIFVTNPQNLKNEMAIIYSREYNGSKIPEKTRNIWGKMFGHTQERTTSGTLCICRLAASGNFPKQPIFYAFPRVNMWDAVIGGFMVEKAGGVFKYMSGKNVFPISKEHLSKDKPVLPPIVAGHPQIVEKMLKLV